ncbi:hypothetical protein PsYK624_150680 [Phanerochaete sordida]|uniref:Uncharacterized protein n=1 Tax=Phanerochaete sordida TaxID=48140 RepID=A0A9P3LKS7_9APHY|nr:hypothetical protein PsYK624_150680 [Phanerochaete sordida]
MARRSSKKTNRSTAARTGTARPKKEKTAKRSERGREPGPRVSAVPSIYVIPELREPDAEEENVPTASFAPKSAPIAFTHTLDACGRAPHAGLDDGTAPRGFRPQDSLTPRVLQMLGGARAAAPVLSPVFAAPVRAAAAKGGDAAKAAKGGRAAKDAKEAKDPKAAKGAQVTQGTPPAEPPSIYTRLEPAAVMDQCWSIRRAVAELGPPLPTARERALSESQGASSGAAGLPGDVFEMDMEADPALAWRAPPPDDAEDWRTCACRTCACRRLRFVAIKGQPGF